MSNNQKHNPLSSLPENTLSLSQAALFGSQDVDYTDDFALVAACVAGNKKAQNYLYEQHAKSMFYVCLRYCGDRDLAKDLMHDGFIKVFTHLKSFRAEAKLRTWMTRVMANHSISYSKKEARKQLVSINKVEFAVLDKEKNPEELLEKAKAKKNAQEVLEAILKLPTGYRTVISMYALDGYSHKEIAKQLGVTEGTSKSQLAKARKMLLRLVSKTESDE